MSTWRDWPLYSPQCRQDVQRLLAKGGSLTAYRANPQHGPEPRYGSWAWKLEREAERVHKVLHVIACASGTVALTTLLKALYPQGGEIITTAFTFSATVASIQGAGLIPVFVDVTTPQMTLCLDSATRMTTKKTVGYMPVDLFGRRSSPWAMAQVVDACQSVGVQPITETGVWSFNGRKNVPAGEGGAVFTSDGQVAQSVRLQIGHGENFPSMGHEAGGNGHINELGACVAYHGMKAVKARNAHRTKMAQILNTFLSGHERVILPDLAHHALYMYPLVIDKGMEQVADTLYMAGVECQRGYIQPPLHRYRAFQWLRRDALPNTEALSHDRLLLFPQVTPTATRREMEQLGEQIWKALL